MTDTYPTITVDPPWRYDNAWKGLPPYPTLSLGEIREIPIPIWSAQNSHLYLWATSAMLREALSLVECWGFVYKTTLTWIKLTRSSGVLQTGLGKYFRNAHELCLFAVKGSLPLKRSDLPTVIIGRNLGHSRKPDEFYDLVESASPGPYLELFARREREGWTTLGLDLGVRLGGVK